MGTCSQRKHQRAVSPAPRVPPTHPLMLTCSFHGKVLGWGLRLGCLRSDCQGLGLPSCLHATQPGANHLWDIHVGCWAALTQLLSPEILAPGQLRKTTENNGTFLFESLELEWEMQAHVCTHVHVCACARTHGTDIINLINKTAHRKKIP